MAGASMTLTGSASTRSVHKFGFVLTICAGSFLLFLVQPMIARMALPRLGGAPTVWNSAMLVYQALLLAGYAYAHWLGRLAPRRQLLIHASLFVLAALMLPIGLAAGNPPADANPFLWVPMLLLGSIGPLFFIVAAQAPLMQRWYTLSGGGDPYPLYAASNLGSFGGLIAYPLIVEPFLRVDQQSLMWTFGYIALLLLVVMCGLRLPTAAAPASESVSVEQRPARAVVAGWITLAAIPSGLMLSTSLHLTTDIVAMPLLWVVPLGLYLLSFSVAFAANRTVADLLTRVAPFSLLFAACGVFGETTRWPVTFAVASLANLFIVSVALHSMMYARRPAPEHLTRFYLAMSVGGVIGGLFCALAAPLLFDWTYEHPILMAAAALLLAPAAISERTRALWSADSNTARITRWGMILFLFLSMVGHGGLGLPISKSAAMAASFVIIGGAIISLGNRWLYTAAVGALMLSLGGWDKLALSSVPGLMTRSFFGVYSVRDSKDRRTLVHGTTVHGIQNRGSAEREMMPISYYAPPSGVGLAMQAAPALYGNQARIGVIGLGTGTLACYAKAGQAWRFYEIDPVIADIARDASRFTFLSRCLPNPDIAIGDARIVLGSEDAASADLLVVDAFSSDSVPMHLLTSEAFATYRRHLSKSGLLMVHISNRYLDLSPVIASAAARGWHARMRHYRPNDKGEALQHAGSIWVAMSPDPQTIDRLLASDPNMPWEALTPRPGFDAWTDDHASILSIIKLKRQD
jgi:hypothetical protein